MDNEDGVRAKKAAKRHELFKVLQKTDAFDEYLETIREDLADIADDMNTALSLYNNGQTEQAHHLVQLYSMQVKMNEMLTRVDSFVDQFRIAERKEEKEHAEV